jgi:hypothetical protein
MEEIRRNMFPGRDCFAAKMARTAREVKILASFCLRLSKQSRSKTITSSISHTDQRSSQHSPPSIPYNLALRPSPNSSSATVPFPGPSNPARTAFLAKYSPSLPCSSHQTTPGLPAPTGFKLADQQAMQRDADAIDGTSVGRTGKGEVLSFSLFLMRRGRREKST